MLYIAIVMGYQMFNSPQQLDTFNSSVKLYSDTSASIQLEIPLTIKL